MTAAAIPFDEFPEPLVEETGESALELHLSLANGVVLRITPYYNYPVGSEDSCEFGPTDDQLDSIIATLQRYREKRRAQ